MPALQHVHLPPSCFGRDPVGALVEEQLQELAHANDETFNFSVSNAGWVVATFGSTKVTGETLDVAILRLASALLDDPRFTKGLTRALRSVTALRTGSLSPSPLALSTQ